LARRARGGGRRGISGLGLVLVLAGLLAMAVSYSRLGPLVARLWPLGLVAVGVFGVLRRPGWVEELDVRLGAAAGRDGRGRLFSLALAGAGLLCLVFTTGLVSSRVIGPAAVIVLGLFLVWRRAR